MEWLRRRERENTLNIVYTRWWAITPQIMLEER